MEAHKIVIAIFVETKFFSSAHSMYYLISMQQIYKVCILVLFYTCEN